jgi:hypothetical protein
LAAATIFIALVIFCVDLTEPMRILRALSDAIFFFLVLLRKQEPRVVERVACDSGLLLSQER